jgi:hypothetical protein
MDPSSVPATVAHGSTFQQARVLHAFDGNEDQTAVSEAKPSGRWAGDDDKTELNQSSDWASATDVADPGDFTAPSRPNVAPDGSGDWTKPSAGQRRSPAAAFASSSSSATSSFRELTPLEPELPRPNVGAGSWRTPDAYADDIDADDHTMPFPERQDFGEGVASPDDITETAFGPSSASGRPSQAPVRIAAVPARDLAVSDARPAPRRVQAPAAPVRAPASTPRAAAAAGAPAGGAATARRIPRPRPAPVMAVAPATPATMGADLRAEVAPSAPIDFTATQVINSLGRQPEAWESALAGAHRLKVSVPDLAGYVVSRIGTPKASTRRTIQIPVRATHMDTLMPQDFVLDLDFRAGAAGSAPALSAGKRSAEPEGKTVPMSWFIGLLSISAVVVGTTLFFWLGQG